MSAKGLCMHMCVCVCVFACEEGNKSAYIGLCHLPCEARAKAKAKANRLKVCSKLKCRDRDRAEASQMTCVCACACVRGMCLGRVHFLCTFHIKKFCPQAAWLRNILPTSGN